MIPAPLHHLLSILNLPKYPHYPKSVRKRWTPYERRQVQLENKRISNLYTLSLKPYLVGTWRDCEGNGWYVERPLYLYDDKHYG